MGFVLFGSCKITGWVSIDKFKYFCFSHLSLLSNFIILFHIILLLILLQQIIAYKSGLGKSRLSVKPRPVGGASLACTWDVHFCHFLEKRNPVLAATILNFPFFLNGRG
jgi:hypothetical protein